MPDSIETASPPSHHTFGQLLHRLRKNAGLTLRQLADCVGYDEGQISRLENNLRHPDLTIIENCFLPALGLATDSADACRLMRLAAEARQSSLSQTTRTLTRKRSNHQRLNRAGAHPTSAGPPSLGTQALPLRLTSFIGRTQLITKVLAILRHHRLVTLTGVGGGGKTSIALEIARHYLEQPVYWVELESVTDPVQVARTIALAIGGDETVTQSVLTTITRLVADRTCYLFLDNCEHLLDTVPEVAQTLLRTCPNLSILATSRERLNVAGEQIVEVPPMTLPILQALPDLATLRQSEAVQLFVERAQNNWPDFALNPQNGFAVAELCHRLDGMPLAIELAAGWVKSLRVEEIMTQLTHRFHLLTNGSPTQKRHQSLRNLLDWSYGLLQPDERSLLRKLAVFRGGFSLDAVEAVTQGWKVQTPLAVLQQLHRLVAKSLVIERRVQGYTARYHLLESIREYSTEKLAEAGETSNLEQNHFAYFLHLAEEAELKLKGPEQAVWLQRMSLEQENFRTALLYAFYHSPEAGLQLLLYLQHFCNVRGYWCEWEEWLAKLMTRPRMPPATKVGARALNLLALIAANQSEADKLFAMSATLCRSIDDRHSLAHYHFCQGNRLWWENSAKAKAHFEQSLLIFREIGDQWHTAYVLRALGELVQVRLDALSEARSLLTLSLQLYRELADDWGIAEALAYLANTALAQSDPVGVQTYAQEALQLSEYLDFKEGIFWASLALGVNEWSHGHYAKAAPLLQDASSVANATGDQVYNAVADYWLATNSRYQGEYLQATTLYQNIYRASRKKLYWWGIGFSLYGLGEVARLEGNISRSIKYLMEALVALDQINYRRGIICILNSFARLAFPEISAVYFFSSAAALRSATETSLYAVEEREINQVMTTLQSILPAETFAAAWATGQALTTSAAIEYALKWAANHSNRCAVE